MQTSTVLSVSQLNFYIKTLIEADAKLFSLYVSGEISNFKRHFKSGHCYFTLKDKDSVLKVVMFSAAASALRFQPQDGMKVTVKGRISVYERDGAYQLYAQSIQSSGDGELEAALERIKERLSKQGLFDDGRKRPLPLFPERVGVVTSLSSAAIHDILTVLERRYPSANVVVRPVKVEGLDAPADIINAVNEFNESKAADVLIVGRGGGSKEELWAFNDEALAHCIAESVIPVISAVGHESDYTIMDFVADMRAPTPSAAAELAVPDSTVLKNTVNNMQMRMINATDAYIYAKEYIFKTLDAQLALKGPSAEIEARLKELSTLDSRLVSAAAAAVLSRETALSRYASLLDALSPLKILSRGYAIAVSADSGREGEIIRSVKTVKNGDRLDINLTDGKILCNIIGAKEL